MLTSCFKNILIIVINKSAKSGIGVELFYLLIGLIFKLYTLLGLVYDFIYTINIWSLQVCSVGRYIISLKADSNIINFQKNKTFPYDLC